MSDYDDDTSKAMWLGERPQDYEPFFSQWMQRLTADGLHAKSDIALELAKQQARIRTLTKALRKMQTLLDDEGYMNQANAAQRADAIAATEAALSQE